MHFSVIDKDDFKKTNRISRKYNTQWKRFAGRNSIGDCSNLFQRLRPESYYDFYVKYTADGEKTAHNRSEFLYYGRTEEEIEEVAKKYRDACGDYAYTLEEYIKNVYMHAIIETFDGQIKEQEVNQILSNLGYTYEKPQGDEDSCLGIDFKVFKDNKIAFILQIKPISFFLGTKNQSLIEDRIGAFEKQTLVTERFNVPTYYMIYKSDNEGNVSWLSKNGKLCFRLDCLCNEKNGYPYKLSDEFVSI